MTEAEWQSSTSPQDMLERFRRERPEGGECYDLSDRKLRLSACAMARAVESHDACPDWVKVIQTAEQYADGLPTPFGPSNKRSLEVARRSIDSVYGWLWCATQPAIGRAVYESLCTEQGFQARWTSPAAADALREVLGSPVRPVTLPYVTVRTEWVKGGTRRIPKLARPMVPDVGDHEVDIYGCPWLTPPALAVARAAYDDRDFALLPLVADALEDGGCDDEDLLRHLRGEEQYVNTRLSGPRRPVIIPGRWEPLRSPHVRGCFALDLILGYL